MLSILPNLKPLPRKEFLAYGALGLPLAMAALPMYVHVPRLYAELSGMSLSLLGMLLLVARLTDAGINPILGGWSDRAAKRQHLILLALPLLALSMVALLHPPQVGAPLWLLGSMLLTNFAFSLASISYQAWGAELGQNSGERTRLTASREGFGLLGVVLAATLPGLFSSNTAQGLSWLCWVFVPLLFLLAAVTLWGAPQTSQRAPVRGKLLGELMRILADLRFRRLLIVFAVNEIAVALPATLVLFFVADVLQAELWGGAFLALYFVSGIAFLPLWISFSQRFGQVRAWIASMALSIAAFSCVWILGPGDLLAFAFICLFSGAALGADLTFPAAILADIAQGNSADIGNSVQAGGYFGCWNVVAKINLALTAGLSLILLDLVGYRPGVAETTAGLSAVYCLLPLFLKTIAAVLAWRWQNNLESTI